MNLIVRVKNLQAEPRIRRFAANSLSRALHRFNEQIIDADIFMQDVNGPKGGDDKHVITRLRMADGKVLTGQSTRDDAYKALSDSIQKVKKSVRRTVRKNRRPQRRPLRETPITLSAKT